MTIQEIKDGENLTLQLGGRLDTTTAPDLEKVVNSDLDDVKNLVLDMKELKYVSSAGLRVLLTLQKKMNEQGSLKLLNVCDEIKEVLDITGFTSFLTIE
jgi:anti-sigma B factor antagonist